MKLLTFISAGAFILFSAFVMKKEGPSIYDTKWSLKKIHTETGVQDVATKAFIRFDKEKNSAGGNGSCNSFGSTVTIEGKNIHFSNIFSTKMYCEEVQRTEDLFFQQLEKADRYTINGNTLTLYDNDTIVLELEAA